MLVPMLSKQIGTVKVIPSVIPAFGIQLVAKQLSLDGQALYGLSRNPVACNARRYVIALDSGFRLRQPRKDEIGTLPLGYDFFNQLLNQVKQETSKC